MSSLGEGRADLRGVVRRVSSLPECHPDFAGLRRSSLFPLDPPTPARHYDTPRRTRTKAHRRPYGIPLPPHRLDLFPPLLTSPLPLLLDHLRLLPLRFHLRRHQNTLWDSLARLVILPPFYLPFHFRSSDAILAKGLDAEAAGGPRADRQGRSGGRAGGQLHLHGTAGGPKSGQGQARGRFGAGASSLIAEIPILFPRS